MIHWLCCNKNCKKNWKIKTSFSLPHLTRNLKYSLPYSSYRLRSWGAGLYWKKVVTITLSLSYFYVFDMLNHLQTVERYSISHPEIVIPLGRYIVWTCSQIFFGFRMNNSRDGQDSNSRRLLFVLAINLSVFFVSLAFICHLTALIALFRPELRRRLFTPFMINLCVISMVLAGCSYFLPLGLDKLRQDVNENAQKEMFVCNWTAFMGILCKSAYSSTVCAMSVVSKIALKRCTCGETQVISRKRKLILFSALWAYPLVLSGIPSFLKDPFGRSASGLMCQLRWPSKENAHNIYNIFSSIALFLPMAICFKAQYDFAR